MYIIYFHDNFKSSLMFLYRLELDYLLNVMVFIFNRLFIYILTWTYVSWFFFSSPELKAEVEVEYPTSLIFSH